MTINFEPLIFIICVCALIWLFIPQIRKIALFVACGYTVLWFLFLAIVLMF